MLHAIVIGVASILGASAVIEGVRLIRARGATAAGVAAANAQTLQRQQAASVTVAPIQQVAQQAVQLAQQQDTSAGPAADPTGGAIPQGTLDPTTTQQASIAANIAATQAAIQAGHPPTDNFSQAVLSPTPVAGVSQDPGIIQTSSDPTLVQQAQNILGI